MDASTRDNIHLSTWTGIFDAVLSCFETSKNYEVMNDQGQRIYFAEERSNCFFRYLCGPSRSFTMTIYDNVGRDVITMHKALRNCYLQKDYMYFELWS
ncbi:phospholipid scramblase 2 [Ailuropoda melanoleuca]|uniref:phospholipid scramblase 2 n=1 Tax=Ailuropoda melanoleuca TaxID=9646 RepID=UPI0014948A18|nr:phospholipid scramblase 2 [Ailuropoda melanoleuca]